VPHPLTSIKKGDRVESLKYLEAARKKLGDCTDYRLAKTLGLSYTAVRQYRKEMRVMDTYACMRVADVIGAQFELVVAAAEYDRENDETRKMAWARLLKKSGALCVAAVCLFTFDGSLLIGQGSAWAFSGQATNYATRVLRSLQHLVRLAVQLARRAVHKLWNPRPRSCTLAPLPS
jgi:predicted transcriptional regulator